jgi:hypothetical protein
VSPHLGLRSEPGMPLQISHDDPKGQDLACPAILCDHCGKEITDARDGNYEFRCDEHAVGPTLYFTHKACCAAFDDAQPHVMGAMELDVMFVYLANRLKLDWDKAKKRAAMLGSIEI